MKAILSKLFCHSCEKGNILKGKDLLTNFGSKFFSFGVDPFSEGIWNTRKQTGRSHKSGTIVQGV